jgi:hypothetical protein
MGWYFKFLENYTITIPVENNINPVLKVTPS